ncbi:ATP-binding protein [Prosthecomicrobium sp. N25]|uniref:ATP-binding protein n=1 Tax=Prosthecomicrobium sp. N25 TaxID=3129254 RepID=UPI0030779308
MERTLNATPRAAAVDHVLISTTAPNRSQVWLAVGVVVSLFAAMAGVAPYASQSLPNTEVLLPAYAAGVLVIELITSALLVSLFHVQRCRAILLLASGYLFSGTLIVPWVLTYPGLFNSFGIDEGLQSTAAIAALRRLGFPLFILAYAVLSERSYAGGSVRLAILGMIAAVAAVVCLTTWLVFSNDRHLPDFMIDARNVGLLWRYIPVLAGLIYLAGMVALSLRFRTILDLWLMVVLVTLLIEVVQISYLGSGVRLGVGWWAGRLFGLASASIVLVVLLSETTAVYTRLARSEAAQRRTRQNRLTAMEALSASIAHEVNQPLASMVTNADAGLRWLDKADPHLDEAKAAMKRIVDEGHRASKIVSSIRTMFMKSARERERLDVNDLIVQVIKASEADARLGRVSVNLDLDRGAPHVIGNAVQLQQVMSNLIDNAVEAMRSVGAGQRTLRLVTRQLDHGDVLVSVEDTGSGLDAAHLERIFDPFFTTKPDGMGMGLMFCRTVIDAHGGRLWAGPNSPRGAAFRFSLPPAINVDTGREEE